MSPSLALAVLAVAVDAKSPQFPPAAVLVSQAQAWVASICAQRPDHCGEARVALKGYESLLPETQACEAGPCAEARIRDLGRSLYALDRPAAALPGVPGVVGNGLLRLSALGWRRLGAGAERIRQPSATIVSSDDETNAPRDVERLCLEVPADCGRWRQSYEEARALTPEIEACRAAACAFETIDALTVRAERALSKSLGNPPGAKTETYNIFSFANVRLTKATGLLAASVDHAARRLAARPQDAGVSAGGSAGPSRAGFVSAGVGKPTLIDGRAVPPTAAGTASAPPIVDGKFSAVQNGVRLASADPLVQADARRRLGLTTTIGAPGVYAPLVYAQDSPQGCAIAAQLQILRAHGLLPSGDLKDQEKALVAEARRRGVMLEGGGTSFEFEGSLLVAHGLLVRKSPRAPWPDLEAAIRRGSVTQVSVDARFIWGYPTLPPLPHSILITGAEADRATGALIGVYINDSGSDPPRGGRFLPINDLKKAWTGAYAEVL